MPPGSAGVVRARRVVMIANPVAGLRRGRPAGELAERAATRAGARVDLVRTQGPDDARLLARAAAASGTCDLVIAAGGDGTAHEVANGLVGTDVPLAVAPSGTMNLLARVLGVPLDPADAAGRAVEGFRPLLIRPGEVAGRVFLLMAGAGFDAWVLRELLRGAAGKIGFADYVRGAVRGLASFPFPRMTVRAEGRVVEGHSAIVGRAPLYGGFLRPTPHVRLEDDTLELCVLGGGALALAAVFPRLWSGAHAGRPGVVLERVGQAVIASGDADVPYQLDGELAGALPMTVAISDRSVTLAAPVAR